MDSLITQGGSEGVNSLRDRARTLAPQLNLEDKYRQIDGLIGTALGTRSARTHSSRLRARARGNAYDPDRLALFEHLKDALEQRSPILRPVVDAD